MITHGDWVAPKATMASIRSVAEIMSMLARPNDEPRLNIVDFLEKQLPLLDPTFAFVVSTDGEMGLNEALTHLHDRTIEVAERVYLGALEGKGRDRVTLAHELGHLILHADAKLARRPSVGRVTRQQCPEWQADCFARHLLIPLSHYRGCKNPEEAARLFGVPRRDLEIQIQNWRTEGVLK